MSEKFRNGAFIFSRIRGLEPRDPNELVPVAKNHGINEAIIPPYPGDRAAFVRSIGQASRGLSKKGFLVRPIKRAPNEVIYGIVREEKDESSRRLDHEFEATVSWSKEPDPSVVYGDHPVAKSVAEAFSTLRGKIVADDWSSSITSYLEGHDAAPMRGDGRVYWAPPQRLEQIRRFGTFLQAVGIDLIMCEIEPETQAIVREVAHSSIDDELERLQAEVAEFDGRQNAATYKRRLDEYQRLRERTILYRDALGVGAERANLALCELERKVEEMLKLRKQLVIPRGQGQGDLAAAPKPTPRPKSNLFDTVTFSGITFRFSQAQDGHLSFVSNSSEAKESINRLKTLGFADKWHQVGPIKMCISNGGADVSVQFRPADMPTLGKAAPALRQWGVELG